jgi:hypothetical protein
VCGEELSVRISERRVASEHLDFWRAPQTQHYDRPMELALLLTVLATACGSNANDLGAGAQCGSDADCST